MSILIRFSTSTPLARITSTPTRLLTSPCLTTWSFGFGIFPPRRESLSKASLEGQRSGPELRNHFLHPASLSGNHVVFAGEQRLSACVVRSLVRRPCALSAEGLPVRRTEWLH